MNQIKKGLIGRNYLQEDMAEQAPKYELLSNEKTKEMLKVFKGERTGWVLVGPKKYFFPSRYIEQGAGFYNFKARVDDTWVASYPRSGLYCSINGEKNDLLMYEYFLGIEIILKNQQRNYYYYDIFN